MHSSCAHVILSRIATSCTTGTEARKRSTTEVKITTVATAISAPISVSSSRSSSLRASMETIRTLMQARGRLFPDQFVDHVLADAVRDLRADRSQRLDPGITLVCGQVGDPGAPRLLDRRHRILVVLARDLEKSGRTRITHLTADQRN